MRTELSDEAKKILETGVSAGLASSALSDSTKLCDRAIEDVIADISLQKAGTGRLMHALVEIVKCQAHEILIKRRDDAMSYARG